MWHYTTAVKNLNIDSDDCSFSLIIPAAISHVFTDVSGWLCQVIQPSSYIGPMFCQWCDTDQA